MHNMLLDSTLPFRSGPGADGIQIRPGSSLASVFRVKSDVIKFRTMCKGFQC